ncbi:MAG: type IV pilus modification protein PilV [Burkholderiales bacterium]|nr:type IV pilus modification protein PilV [Burkholderiales bacterium]MDE2276781.1 type IV pilus modification protein PilV [Burkholderiales bacterium]
MNPLSMPARRGGGFSLIEVLIAIVVIAVGLLGVAKLQAAAVSSTQTSRVRSLIALQAGSLAAAMHGNRRYWAAGAAPASWSAAGATITDATGVLNAAGVNCLGSGNTCTAPQLAAYDVQAWVAAMNAQFPSYTAAVTCSTSVTTPISCAIQINWNENLVAINRSTAASAPAAPVAQQFTLLVEP